MPFIDITGKTFGRLTVLEEVKPRCKPPKWLCQCVCGNTKEIIGASLKNGSTKSCGCLHIERNKELFTKHGDYRDRLYSVFSAMHQRCNNPKHRHFRLYGGRGITVCNEWEEYSNFKKWALSNGYRPGLSIDRRDNNLGYTPDNCRWVQRITQSRNRNPLAGKTSRFIGVHWDSDRKKWFASISINNEYIALGRYSDEVFAARVRDQYIKDNNLKDFVLNFEEE